MAPCCLGGGASVKEFIILLIRVLHVSHPAALEGSTCYAREIVDGFFKEHTNFDVTYIEPHNYKFCNLAVESCFEIAFVGRPKGYKVPNCKLFKVEHCEGLTIVRVFQVATRLIKQYIPPNCEFDLVEIERTDYVPLTGFTQRQVADIRVSYVNMGGIQRNR
jgi:hypothetical protein